MAATDDRGEDRDWRDGEGAGGNTARVPGGDTTVLPAEGSDPVATGAGRLELDERAAHRYELGPVHATGGLARIVRARDRRLDRTVAVKELLQPSASAERRFLREAMITARLQHPAIVPVHDLGRRASGDPFYAMTLVSGQTLADAIRARPDLDQRLALIPNVLAVAEAIAYAHSKQIIHRDIKPTNVMVGEFGETVVVDWGLAKDLAEPGSDDPARADGPPAQGDSGHAATRLGQVIGTPLYMAPEQARGEPVDARADVYSLGALLHEVLVGRPPRAGDSAEQILSAAQVGRLAPIAELAPDAPDDLCAIVTKATAPRPADRYPHAIALAEDLRRFQTGQLVTARHYSRWTLLRRWAARHRPQVAAAALATAAVVMVATVSFRQIVAERNTARAAQAQAEAGRDELVFRQAEGWLERDPTTAVAWLAEYPVDGPRADRLAPMIEQALAAGVARHVLRHGAVLVQIAFAADGALISIDQTGGIGRWTAADGWRPVARAPAATARAALSADATLAAVAVDGGDILIQPTDGGPSRRLTGHEGDIRGLQFAADGRRLLTWARDGARIWDLAAAPPTSRPGGPARSAAISRDGATVVLARPGGEIVMLPADGQAGERRLALLQRPITRVALGPDGRRLIAVTDDGVNWLVGTAGEPPRRLGVMKGLGEGAVVAFSQDGERAAIGGRDEVLRVYQLAGGDELALHGHEEWIHDLAFSREDTLLVSAGDDRTVRVWDLRTGEVQVLRGHSDDVVRIAASPDGGLLATASADGTVRVWPLATPQVHRVVPGQIPNPLRAWRSADGELLYSGGMDGLEAFDLARGTSRSLRPDWTRIRPPGHGDRHLLMGRTDRRLALWDGRTGEVIVLPAAHAEPITAVALSDDDRTAVSVDASGLMLAWDVPRQEPRELARGRAATAASFTPDGARVALVGDGWLELRELTTGGRLAQGAFTAAGPVAIGGPIFVEVAADGRRVALVDGSQQSRALMWDLDSGAVRAVRGRVQMVTFSPDARLLGLAGADRVVALWDATTGRTRELGRHADLVYMVAFSPDGRTLASASNDRTARLWDLETGRARVLHHPAPVRALAFSPEGDALLTVGANGNLRTWDLRALPGDDPAAAIARVRTATTAVIDSGRATTRSNALTGAPGTR